MSTLSFLLATHTTLSGDEVTHLQRLASEWQLLSDLSFADFLLWVPVTADVGGAVLPLRRPQPPDDRADRPSRRHGGRHRHGRAAPAAAARPRRHHDAPRGAAPVAPGPVDPPGGGAGGPGRPRDRGPRARHQPRRPPRPLHPRDLLPGGRGRPLPDDRRRHLPGGGWRRRGPLVAAGGRRPRAGQHGRHDPLREPQRRVGVPPARVGRRARRAPTCPPWPAGCPRTPSRAPRP